MYTIVIPAYQPDQKLSQLIHDIKNHLDCQVLVVNDGSSSDCQPIFEKIAPFVTLIHHKTNQGKGQALKTAFLYLKENGTLPVIVTADADGQHSVTDIDRVAHAALRLPNHFVLGVRQFSKDIPLRSRFGNQLTRGLFRLQTGVAVSDTQTGLRAFQTSILPFLLNIDGSRYEYEMNMLSQASQVYPITEVPIETIYIDDNASSHFRPIRDGLLIYKHLFRFALASLGGFAVDYSVYALALLALTDFPATGRLFLANAIARLISVVCNFGLNKKWVFNNQDSLTQTGIGYCLLAATLFVADTSLLFLFHQLLGINLYLVKILVGLTLFFASWVVQKQFIFKERKEFSHEPI